MQRVQNTLPHIARAATRVKALTDLLDSRLARCTNLAQNIIKHPLRARDVCHVRYENRLDSCLQLKSLRLDQEVVRGSSCEFNLCVCDCRAQRPAVSRQGALSLSSLSLRVKCGVANSSQISMILRLDVWSAALDRAAKATFQSGDSFVAMYPAKC